MQSEDKQKQVEALTLVKSMKLEAHLISLLSVGSSLPNLLTGRNLAFEAGDTGSNPVWATVAMVLTVSTTVCETVGTSSNLVSHPLK